MSTKPDPTTASKPGPKGWRELAEEYGVSVATLRRWLSKHDWVVLIQEGYVPYAGYILTPRVIKKIYEILGSPKDEHQ